MSLGMRTSRAHLRSFVTFMQVTTVAASPHDDIVAFEHDPFFNITGQLEPFSFRTGNFQHG